MARYFGAEDLDVAHGSVQKKHNSDVVNMLMKRVRVATLRDVGRVVENETMSRGTLRCL